jgi:hypothetical protein
MSLGKLLATAVIVLVLFLFYCAHDARRLCGFTLTSLYKYFVVGIVFVIFGFGPSVGLTFGIPIGWKAAFRNNSAESPSFAAGVIYALLVCFLGLMALMSVGKTKPSREANGGISDKFRFLISRAEPHLIDYDERIRQDLLVRQEDMTQQLGLMAIQELGDRAASVFSEKYKKIMEHHIELGQIAREVVQERIVKVDGAVNAGNASSAQRAADLFALIYCWGDGHYFTKRRIPMVCREYRRANDIDLPRDPFFVALKIKFRR